MQVKGKKITVLGAARSGISAAVTLTRNGAQVFVSDLGAPKNREETEKLFLKEGITWEFNQHSERVLNAESVILSPGIPVRSQIVQRVLAKKIPVVSEVEAAWWLNKAQIIGVTGSNGKTTTTSLIGAMLQAENPKAFIAGNIGTAFSDFVAETEPDQWGVVELSSFQLETIKDFKPKVMVVLNFAPNHLDRYDSYDDYINAKWRITKNYSEQDFFVYNGKDSELSKRAEQLKCKKASFVLNRKNDSGAAFLNGKIWFYGQACVDVNEIVLKGPHNYMNIMAAGLAALHSGVSMEKIASAIKQFSGIEHRLEWVKEHAGVRYFNDSKATTIESLEVALNSFDEPVVLIAGGKDKGSDFSRLNQTVKKRAKAAVLIGSSKEIIAKSWEELIPIEMAQTMEEAVKKARSIAQKGEIVLLSPACASFDMFSDYEDRGRVFKQIVKSIN